MQLKSIERPTSVPGIACILAAAVLAAACAGDPSQEPVDASPTAPSLASVLVSGIAPAIELVPGTTEYVVDLPLLQQSVTVTATVDTAGDTLTIADTPVDSGAPSPEITLSLGDNPVDIVVENDQGELRTYRLILRRAAELAQHAYGKASNPGVNDIFGVSVALSGDTLAVGALEASDARGINGDQDNDNAVQSGAVYVFRRSGTTWQQEAYIKASNADADDLFGISVALSGDTLAVGASDEDSGATGVNGNQDDNFYPDSGAVYVFRRSGTTWQQEAYIKASNTGFIDSFGISVALSGDTLAVGAHYEDSAATGIDGDQADNTAEDSGAVYVFRRTGTDWQQEAYIKASNTGALDRFGQSVALRDDTLVVTAPVESSAAKGIDGDQADDTAEGSGAVYVFGRTGTAWQQETYIKASNTGAGDRFGITVSLSGDTIAVGAQFEDSAATGVNGNQDDDSAEGSGAVYVFRQTGTAWQQEAYVKASNTGAENYFSGLTGVALAGDTLAVGAWGEESAATGVNADQADESALASGAVYVFRRTGTAWQQEAYVKPSNTDMGDRFGEMLTLSDDTLVVGAWRESSAATGINGDQNDNSTANSGAVYIFH